MQSTRRELLATAGASLALTSLPGFARAPVGADAKAGSMLERIGEMLLGDSPETASSLGLYKDKRARLTHQLSNRTPQGQQIVAGHLRQAIADIGKLDAAALSPGMRVNVDVARTAFESGLEGFAFPFGDVAVGGWRNSPYVVVQNVGA